MRLFPMGDPQDDLIAFLPIQMIATNIVVEHWNFVVPLLLSAKNRGRNWRLLVVPLFSTICIFL